jgi:hypothetical protein
MEEEEATYIAVATKGEEGDEKWGKEIHLMIHNSATVALMEELRDLKWLSIIVPVLHIDSPQTMRNWAMAFSMINPFLTITIWNCAFDTVRFREDTNSLNPEFFSIKPLKDFPVDDNERFIIPQRSYNNEYRYDSVVSDLIASIYTMAVQDDYV